MLFRTLLILAALALAGCNTPPNRPPPVEYRN